MGDRILRLLALIALLTGTASADPGGRVTGKVTITDSDGKPADRKSVV